MDTTIIHTEVPSSLKKLARLVVRGFYSIEDALIVDMLVRNPCMKEDDICDLLKFERKMLRARIATLRNDKFIQVRLKMETGMDGKAQKVNYYFINYKTFVNVVKYKLDHMRKRMETEERDATSRASFKCPSCSNTYTDLEADQLFDCSTGEFLCTFCSSVVEEDQSALPKKDSRLLLAKFNEQMEPLYMLLREVENIKLAPELLDPEPLDISALKGLDPKNRNMRPAGDAGNTWSGEATRSQGFQVEETRVDVTIGDENAQQKAVTRKERPVWMVESTVITDSAQPNTAALDGTTNPSPETGQERGARDKEDIMSVLLAHEKRSSARGPQPVIPDQQDSGSESSEDFSQDVPDLSAEIGTIESDEDEQIPVVSVSGERVAITDINDELIAKMTTAEREVYIQVYQEYYSHMYE